MAMQERAFNPGFVADPPPATEQPQPRPPPGSDASLDVLVQSLEYSFVDLPELIEEDGSVAESEKPVSFNPYVKR